MHKAQRNRALTEEEKQRNKAIGPIRSTIERTFGSIRRWFHGGRCRYRGLAKTHTQNILESIAFNLYRTPGIITYPIIKAQSENAAVIGLVVSINRMERGLATDKSALDEISDTYGFPARAIVSMDDIIDALYTHGDKTVITEDIKKSLDDYYAEWGAKR